MARLAAAVLSHPRAIVALWSVAAVVGGVLSSGLLGRLSDSGFSVPGSQSERVERVMQRSIPGHRGTELFALVTRRGPAAAQLDPVRLVRGALRGVPGIRGVHRAAASVSDDGEGAGTAQNDVVSFEVDAGPAAVERDIATYSAALARRSAPGARVGLFGAVVVSARYSTVARADLARAERIALPFILVLLTFAFVSALAALLPLVLAVVGLVVTFAGLYVIGRHAGLSVFVTNTASVLALGLSVDFSLFIVTRFREELAHGVSVEQALTQTLTSTGRAVALSALTIVTALVALFAIGVQLLTSMATGAMLATAVSALVALTLLPAILCMLGTRVDTLKLGFAARAVERAAFWHRLAGFVVRRPAACAAGATALLLLAAVPLAELRIGLRVVESLPRHDPVREEADRIARAFHPGTPGPIQLVTRGVVPQALWRDGDVAQTWGETYGRDGWFALQVILDMPPETAAARRAVVRLRDLLARRHAKAYVGGLPAASLDLLDRIDERTPWVVGIALLLGACLLGVGLRSVVIPVKAMVGTLLSVGATLGILARAFPATGGEPSVEFFVPLMLFAIVFGLSVDYEVFLLSRVREAFDGGRSTEDAVTIGLVRSARSITLAGATLATVFLALASSRLPAFQQLGVGVAVAILIDVTLVRCVLVPAGVVLLGRWNWWLPWDSRTRAGVPLTNRYMVN